MIVTETVVEAEDNLNLLMCDQWETRWWICKAGLTSSSMMNQVFAWVLVGCLHKHHSHKGKEGLLLCGVSQCTPVSASTNSFFWLDIH